MAGAILLAACEPVPQTLTLTGGPFGVGTVSRFMPPEADLSLSDQLSGFINNASYVGDLEKRVYLLSAPIWPDGVSGATRDVETLALPLPTVSLGTSSTDIAAPDTTKWRGVRAYDIGLCSQHTSWSELAQQLTEGIMDKLRARPESFLNPQHVGVAEAFPILRGLENTEIDRVGFKMNFHADAIADFEIPGVHPGCVNTDVTVSFEVTLGTKPGVFAPPRAGSGCAPLVSTEPIPNANDPTASIQNLVVSVVAEECVFATPEKVAASMVSIFAAELPPGLVIALRDSLLRPGFPFVRDDLPLRRCSCDSECTDGASTAPNPFGAGSGPRHRCVAARCAFQLEPDRFEVRPEGLEVILAEDDSDGQAAVLTDPGRIVNEAKLCDGDRGRVDDRNRAVPGLLIPGTFTAPTP